MTARQPTEAEAKVCPICRDGWMVREDDKGGKLHEAYGFTWRCWSDEEGK